jgi:hypothetical protein
MDRMICVHGGRGRRGYQLLRIGRLLHPYESVTLGDSVSTFAQRTLPPLGMPGTLTVWMAEAIQNRWFWMAVLVRLLSARSFSRGPAAGHLHMGTDVSAERLQGQRGLERGAFRRASTGGKCLVRTSVGRADGFTDRPRHSRDQHERPSRHSLRRVFGVRRSSPGSTRPPRSSTALGQGPSHKGGARTRSRQKCDAVRSDRIDAGRRCWMNRCCNSNCN